jgi:hypothetical protein
MPDLPTYASHVDGLPIRAGPVRKEGCYGSLFRSSFPSAWLWPLR